jgi:DNA replication initiation complex subunit (GINS family)
MEKGGKITYETLFDILRNEKNREELQSLDPALFEDLTAYLTEKKRLLDEAPNGELFSNIEKEKTQKQLENAKKIIKELYERREKKLLNMAMINSRAGGLLDKSAMLAEEKKLFDRLTNLLEIYKTDVLYRLLDGNAPQLRDIEQAPIAAAKPKESKEGTAMLRFLQPVPKFVGKSLEIYGPFEQEDMASLPKEIADVLVSKGRAELING